VLANERPFESGLPYAEDAKNYAEYAKERPREFFWMFLSRPSRFLRVLRVRESGCLDVRLFGIKAAAA
jgi:hypothetical protein